MVCPLQGEQVAMSDNATEEPQAPRQHLVEEAAKFLINPKVASHGEDQKSAFLKKKGLSDEEILAAFSQARVSVPLGKGGSGAPGVYAGALVPAYPAPAPSVWLRVRDVCNVVLVLAGASYGLHYLYKRYLGPWLTGRRHKSVEESVEELEQSVAVVVKEVQTTLAALQHTLSAQTLHIQALNHREGSPASTKQMEQLRSEVSSLKGLLINKRTFPSSPSPAPSIPSWQQRSKAAERPVEPPAESTVSLPNQVQVMGEGESVWSAANTHEASSTEAKGGGGEITEALGVRNGEADDDSFHLNDYESPELPLEATIP
ncbi:Peroxisomal membrane protein PEX14 [Chionoecetes opilio]|uniref:Peroxisomal membrane protein PEX14 n=1 Tax=Chionoecetes opilio TaxID=41210 RepID=A0A8J4Y047_CHIOP|nr:Peroxisomal membrane protein PEX14 [Chionoecetes opilio]